MDDVLALTALRALSQASRLAAFRLLVQAGPAGLPVGALRESLDLPPATLSAHLNVLRAAGLAVDTRAGRVINVRADFGRMNDLLAFLTENCCQGASCAPAEQEAGDACTPAAVDCCAPETTGSTP
ncbi:MAG: ArsR/SmtB family transcription factor [Arenimonas sp.]